MLIRTSLSGTTLMLLRRIKIIPRRPINISRRIIRIRNIHTLRTNLRLTVSTNNNHREQNINRTLRLIKRRRHILNTQSTQTSTISKRLLKLCPRVTRSQLRRTLKIIVIVSNRIKAGTRLIHILTGSTRTRNIRHTRPRTTHTTKRRHTRTLTRLNHNLIHRHSNRRLPKTRTLINGRIHSTMHRRTHLTQTNTNRRRGQPIHTLNNLSLNKIRTQRISHNRKQRMNKAHKRKQYKHNTEHRPLHNGSQRHRIYNNPSIHSLHRTHISHIHNNPTTPHRRYITREPNPGSRPCRSDHRPKRRIHTATTGEGKTRTSAPRKNQHTPNAGSIDDPASSQTEQYPTPQTQNPQKYENEDRSQT